ncbi:hypothetical protein HU735_15010 [Pseudomonas sp. BW16M2]|uniref:hypothetical protein n=1 Tax=Pseudomonas sp. BW16M2 TaxID=2745489 RepID=UPI001647B488|nr:hypothetical protein [Pseudomonas sp. BW16M2]MBC3436731.1 hypothetical protein [Pseudomonas sp. BW16M2]
MVNPRPLALMLALLLGGGATLSLAATDMNDGNSHSGHATDQGKTAGEDGSINNPGGSKDNDSSDTGSDSDAADDAAGGSNSTGEATGSGAGASGGSAEDQDSR